VNLVRKGEGSLKDGPRKGGLEVGTRHGEDSGWVEGVVLGGRILGGLDGTTGGPSRERNALMIISSTLI